MWAAAPAATCSTTARVEPVGSSSTTITSYAPGSTSWAASDSRVTRRYSGRPRVGTTTDAACSAMGNIFPSMPEPTPVDLLVVSPGTTAGWRRVDRELTELLHDLGLSTATATTDFRIAGRLRRGVL